MCTYVHRVYICSGVLHADVDLGAVDGAEERVASGSCHGRPGVAVVAEDALFVAATSRSPVVESDHQPVVMVVVVGEKRNLEATVGTEEVATLAAGYRAQGVVLYQSHAVIVHVDAVVRQLVLVIEVDAKQLRKFDCELSNTDKTSHVNCIHIEM